MAKVTGFSKAGSSSSHRSVRGQPSLSGRDMRAVDALPTWGSRDYMSSEQIRGRGGQAADVYAFGMLLWQARVYGGGGGPFPMLWHARACMWGEGGLAKAVSYSAGLSHAEIWMDGCAPGRQRPLSSLAEGGSTGLLTLVLHARVRHRSVIMN